MKYSGLSGLKAAIVSLSLFATTSSVFASTFSVFASSSSSLASSSATIPADDNVTTTRQRSFSKTVPAGDYSGIAWLGGDKYAVVSDKSANEGFYIFTIDIDSVTGNIRNVVCEDFVECDKGNRDLEGIAWMPERGRILMCGEKDNIIRAYNRNGKSIDLDIPKHISHTNLPGNSGLESLSYNAATKRLWTCNEAAPITLVAYDDAFNIRESYSYAMDAPKKNGTKAAAYAHGVSEVCAMDDGSLLVLEREFYVPKAKIGSSVVCKLYRYNPLKQEKSLVKEWKTRLNLLARSLANYEGMCLGPRLADGRRVVVMIADSQSQYKGILKDWLRTICIE